MWMARQTPLAPSLVAVKVSNQANKVMTSQVIPPQTLPPTIFPAYVPPPVPNRQDQLNSL